MVTELDINILMKDGKPVYPSYIQQQDLLYRFVLDYVLNFSPKCRAILTWGFTDRYSWILAASNYTRGDSLPFDFQMQEVLARVLTDGVYRLSPQSKCDKCLGTSNQTTNGGS
jgi:GH35 family endo-1,4-beta-xylanase